MSKYSSCSVSANSWVIMKKKFITFVYLFWGNWKLQVSTVWDNTPAPSSWLWWWLPSKNANLNIPRLLHLTWHPQTTTVSSRWRRSSVTLMMMLFPLWTTFWKSKTLTSTKKGSVCSVGSNCVNVGWDYVENNCARFSEISSVCLRSWTHQSSHVQHFRLEWSMLSHSAFLNMWTIVLPQITRLSLKGYGHWTQPIHVLHARIFTCVCCCLTAVFLSLQHVYFVSTCCRWFTSCTCCCCPGSCLPINTPSEVRPFFIAFFPFLFLVLWLVMNSLTYNLSVYVVFCWKMRRRLTAATWQIFPRAIFALLTSSASLLI